MAWNREKAIKYRYHAGDKVGYWTVLVPEILGHGEKRKTLCRCICGTERAIITNELARGKTLSCGCRRTERQSEKQKEGYQKGRSVLKEIHDAKATAGLPHRLNKNSKTGYTGVSYMMRFRKFRAYITVNRKQIYLGVFDTLEEAVEARKEAELKYFGKYRDMVKAIKEKHKEEK